MAGTAWAYEMAETLLAGPLPRRWAHSQGVAARARALAPLFGDEAELLEAAAILHDIGYAPELASTGFHPLDGGRYLHARPEADDRITRLVAHHSFAALEAEERGLRPALEAEFPLLENPQLVEALVCCDMTTTPDGLPTSSRERIAEIRSRYGDDSIVGRFIRRAEPHIHEAVDRTHERATAAGIRL
ncbi:HD domain-containing protein [Streptomyces aidingensis]|nr:HD domain-containing protein [Streptomyces aidingensis]